MTSREMVRSARDRIERAACVLRTVIGVPDYERYLAHMRVHHPDAQPMTKDDFVQQRLVDRYSRPGSRCC
jgi:uncharacterized short protein YbdD (DUF466 family)